MTRQQYCTIIACCCSSCCCSCCCCCSFFFFSPLVCFSAFQRCVILFNLIFFSFISFIPFFRPAFGPAFCRRASKEATQDMREQGPEQRPAQPACRGILCKEFSIARATLISWNVNEPFPTLYTNTSKAGNRGHRGHARPRGEQDTRNDRSGSVGSRGCKPRMCLQDEMTINVIPTMSL
ncbi:hypothetical protein BD289DRAFT_143434 [Coniella lustricola]|uniref:Uncharacterized protein n=1 Tax=Coniella lustricola TaxID=2025994 RepID=A0A2T3AEU9_9PEZI|nr:hypothetical protein BD289DRAFT_143434 [Coniella lustricola]